MVSENRERAPKTQPLGDSDVERLSLVAICYE